MKNNGCTPTDAAYQLARARAKRTGSPGAYESVAATHRGTAWGEDDIRALREKLPAVNAA